MNMTSSPPQLMTRNRGGKAPLATSNNG